MDPNIGFLPWAGGRRTPAPFTHIFAYPGHKHIGMRPSTGTSPPCKGPLFHDSVHDPGARPYRKRQVPAGPLPRRFRHDAGDRPQCYESRATLPRAPRRVAIQPEGRLPHARASAPSIRGAPSVRQVQKCPPVGFLTSSLAAGAGSRSRPRETEKQERRNREETGETRVVCIR